MERFKIFLCVIATSALMATSCSTASTTAETEVPPIVDIEESLKEVKSFSEILPKIQSEKDLQTTSTQKQDSTALFENFIQITNSTTSTTNAINSTAASSTSTTVPKPITRIYTMSRPTNCLDTPLEGSEEEFVSLLFINCLYRVADIDAENPWVIQIKNGTHTREYVRDTGVYRSPEANCLRGIGKDCGDGAIPNDGTYSVDCQFDNVEVPNSLVANRLRSICGTSLQITIT